MRRWRPPRPGALRTRRNSKLQLSGVSRVHLHEGPRYRCWRLLHQLLPYGPLTVGGHGGRPGGRRHRAARRRGVAVRRNRRGDGRGGAARAAEIVKAAALGTTGRTVVTDPAGQRALWRVRDDAVGTAAAPARPAPRRGRAGRTARCPRPGCGAYLREFRRCWPASGCAAAAYGHFGDGCVHVRIDFDLLTPRRGAALPRLLRGRGGAGASRTAVPCPASTATGRRGPSCCPRCTAPEPGPPSSSASRTCWTRRAA